MAANWCLVRTHRRQIDLQHPVLLQAGISTDWLIGALRRPEAKLVERIKMAETSCLHVEVKWKPDWDTADRAFDIMICPSRAGCLGV